MHTHFFSATNLASTFLGVLLVGSLWRLVAMHMAAGRNAHVAGFGRAMLAQF